jgi:acyl-coenzyme A thioesterase 9
VVWVGSSSLDVQIEVHKAGTSHSTAQTVTSSTCLLSSFFTYVARNRETQKAAAVCPLTLSTAEEQTINELRVQAALQRKAQRSSAASGADAQLDATALKWIEQGSAMQDMPALAPNDAVLMSRTGLENSVVCQPQNVNTGGRVFGGYISKCALLQECIRLNITDPQLDHTQPAVHRAFDLALATSYIFSGVYPVFLEVRIATAPSVSFPRCRSRTFS